jgi:hypothetical protein
MKAAVCLISIFACSSCATVDGSRWSPDASYFDGFIETRRDSILVALRDRIVALYALVHARDWSSVYDFRISDFRGIVGKGTFAQSMASEPFRFDGYEVLACGYYKDAPERLKARLIMKFQQGRQATYEVVWWRLEDGVWKVENLGLNGPSLGEALIGETVGSIPEPNQSSQRNAMVQPVFVFKSHSSRG